MKQVTISVLLLVAVVDSVSTTARGENSDGGLHIFLASALSVDTRANTVTLPLFRGRTMAGQTTWYVITDSSDRDDARARGVNFAPKLANALGTAAVQPVHRVEGVVEFPGTVDFRPTRILVAGPTGFPPSRAEAGSIGDAAYTPLVTAGDGVVLNAPQVANGSGVHDKVVSIDFDGGKVTLALTAGFYNGHAILYLSTEASNPVAATLEASTFTPNLDAAPGIASDDKATSARAGIVPFVNGATGVDDPERQGLSSAVLGEGAPLNVTQHHPGNRDDRYSPLWDVHPAVWTEAAIANGDRQRLTSFQEIEGAVAHGLLVSGGSGPANPDLEGLQAAGFLVNCPIVVLF
jgi:hypothetical protein